VLSNSIKLLNKSSLLRKGFVRAKRLLQRLVLLVIASKSPWLFGNALKPKQAVKHSVFYSIGEWRTVGLGSRNQKLQLQTSKNFGSRSNHWKLFGSGLRLWIHYPAFKTIFNYILVRRVVRRILQMHNAFKTSKRTICVENLRTSFS